MSPRSSDFHEASPPIFGLQEEQEQEQEQAFIPGDSVAGNARIDDMLKLGNL